MPQKIRKTNAKKDKNNLVTGVVHIQSTFNNTIITITNLVGDTISWASAGSSGFKGARKSSAFAAKSTAEFVARLSVEQGLNRVRVNIKGIGPGRKTAIRGLLKGGLKVANIRDITGIPHNGCRPPKKRRV